MYLLEILWVYYNAKTSVYYTHFAVIFHGLLYLFVNNKVDFACERETRLSCCRRERDGEGTR